MLYKNGFMRAGWMAAGFFVLALFFLSAGCDSGDSSEYVSDDVVVSTDSSMKTFGQQPHPPFLVDPEDPAPGGEVTIEVDIEGATTITFTATGADGCGTVASTSGVNPLTVTGTVGTKGYCDMSAEGDNGQVYEGWFDVEAENPDIPAIYLPDNMWEEAPLPDANDGGPVITSISGSSSVTSGSTNTFTVHYTSGDQEEVAGVFMRVGGHEHGHFYQIESGSGGEAAFEIVVDTDYFADSGASSPATQELAFVVVDNIGRFSAQYSMTLTIFQASADLAAAASTTCSVAGKVTYEKFIVSESGRSATGTMVPVRQATVKAISSKDNTTVLGQGTTGEDGNYSISFTCNSAHPSYYVYAYTTSTSLDQSVVNLSKATYSFKSSEEVNSSTEAAKTGLNIEVMDANNSGALNIWDVTVSANAYAKASSGTAPPRVSIYWQKGRNRSKDAQSYYGSDNAGNPIIVMAGATDDPDEYDDMVIGHEYGHFVMGKLSTDDTPGGNHRLDERVVPTLALSEAWATFFAGATLNRSLYIDTDGAREPSVSYSFETPPSTCPKGTSDSTISGNVNEVTANAVIWDILDQTNETKDTLQKNGAAIWKIMTVYLKEGYAKFTDRGYEGRDLIDFLDGWICLGYGNLGTDNTNGLKGAAIGLMELPADFVKSDLASCR